MIDLKSEDAGQMQLIEREDIDDDGDLFEAIDKLISQGSNAGDVKKLQDAGIYTCNGLMMQTKKNLTGIKGLSEAKVDKICEASEKLVNFGYVTGNDVLRRRKSLVKITTGSQALDELLGGGIKTLCITEAFGEFRSGKTQLAHALCVSTQLPINMIGGNGKVAYNDTEGTFWPDRIVPTAERFGMDPGAVFDNIIYARDYTYQHQYNLLLGLAAKMAEEPFRLLIVDSVIALIRVDFTGRGELAERQQKLAQMLSRLTKIAEEFNVGVYMNNQVSADPGGGMFISDPKKPAGGHVLAHAATIRLIFRKGESIHTLCVSTQLPVEDSDEYNGHQEDEGDYEEYAEEHEDGENESHSNNDNDKDSQGSNGADEMEDFKEKEGAMIEAEFNRKGDPLTVFYTNNEFEDNFGIHCYEKDPTKFLLFAKSCVYQTGHIDDVDVSYLDQDGNEVPIIPYDWYQCDENCPAELFVCSKGFLNEIKSPNVVPVEYFIYQTKGKHEVIEETHSVTTEDLSLFATFNEFMEHLRLQKFPLLTPHSHSYYYGRKAPDQKRFFLTAEEKRWVCVKQTVTKIRVCPRPKRKIINRIKKESDRRMEDETSRMEDETSMY